MNRPNRDAYRRWEWKATRFADDLRRSITFVLQREADVLGLARRLARWAARREG